MKRCFKCGETKPLSDYYAHKQMADGHLNKCKLCAKKDVHQHRHGAGRQKVLAYDIERARLPHRVQLRHQIVNEWMAQHPDRRKAQTRLRYAVKCGHLFKWPVCALPECDQPPEAHHPDYDRPLDVVWLCRAHHRQAHAELIRTFQP